MVARRNNLVEDDSTITERRETDMAFKKFTSSEEMLKPDPRHNSKIDYQRVRELLRRGEL